MQTYLVLNIHLIDVGARKYGIVLRNSASVIPRVLRANGVTRISEEGKAQQHGPKIFLISIKEAQWHDHGLQMLEAFLLL